MKEIERIRLFDEPPRLRQRIRRTILLTTALVAVSFSAAEAQSRYTSLTAFGDSYADSGINNFLHVLANPSAYPSKGMSPAAVAVVNPYVAYPYALQSHLGLSNAQVTNYAIGGSTTQILDAYGVPVSLPYQLARFAGGTFGPSDLVTLSIGGNDALSASGTILPLLGYGPTGVQFTSTAALALAKQSTTAAAAAVNQLVDAGARNFVIAGFTDLNALPLTAVAPNRQSLTLYSQAYFEGLQTSLAPLARSGVRIFLIDETRLARQIGANLSAYGFQSYRYVDATTQSLYQPEGIHFTTLGFDYLARYMTNLINAPDTVAAQADVSQLVAASFAGSLFQRLDGYRSFSGYGCAPDKSLASATSCTQGAQPSGSPFSVYLEGVHYNGSRSDRIGANGFNYDLDGGTVAAAYKINPNVQVGAAFNYSNPTANLTHSAGHIDMDAYQFGGYASFTYPNWFSDFVTTYGRDQYQFDRTGILSPVRGDTNGDTFTVGGRGGYLFPVSAFRLGPIAGLNYTKSHIGTYTESGDPLLTFTVAQPDLDSLTGDAGVQVRLPFAIAGEAISPYLNLTVEHDFISADRTLLSIETQAPLLPIYSNVPGLSGGTYGKVAAGVSTTVGGGLSALINVSSTFAREGGNDFGVSGGLQLAFATQ